jgi:protocatechuate 3,4-dioxygenase beta subunit
MSASIQNSLLLLFVLLPFAAPQTVSAQPESAQSIPCLSGFVRDSNGTPVVGADLDFINAQGIKLVTRNDDTDAFGFYQVCVLPGIYQVTFAPPLGTRLTGKQVFGVDLTGNVGKEMNVTLDFGTVVSGTVSNPDSGGIGGVDVDVDRLSGGRVFTPDGDSETVTGKYRVVVPNADYRIRFAPLPGVRWRGFQIDSVAVRADTVINVLFVEGALLSGRVTDEFGNGLPAVDVDLRDRGTGDEIFIANNATDDQGEYIVAVPTGDFHLRFVPPPGSRFVAATVDSFAITSDQTWNQTLASGVMVTVSAEDSTGAPVPGVDLDVNLESTGEKIFTPYDKTNSQGSAVVTLLPAVYTFELDPPPGTTFDQLILTGVAIVGDTTIVARLREVRRVSVSGRVTDPAGGGLAGVAISARRQPGGTEVFIPNDRTDAEGLFDLWIPVGTYDVLFAPARGSRLVGGQIESVEITADSAWGVVQLQEGLLVTSRVRDQTGRPLANADLDFTLEAIDKEIYTPYDNTDADGVAVTVLPVGRYKVTVEPPAVLGFTRTVVRGLEIRRDTTLTFELSRDGGAASHVPLVYPNFPNPFNVQTTIGYVVPESGQASVRVYDVSGRLVRVLESGFHTSDTYFTTWDGRDPYGRRVASGVYFLRLEGPEASATRKIILVR